MNKLLVTVFTAFFMFSALCRAYETRTWTSKSGASVIASLESWDENEITLRTDSGKLLKIKRDQMSAADQQYVLALEQSRQQIHRSRSYSDNEETIVSDWMRHISDFMKIATNTKTRVFVVNPPTAKHLSAFLDNLPDAITIPTANARKMSLAESGQYHWLVGLHRGPIEQVAPHTYRSALYYENESFPFYFSENSFKAVSTIQTKEKAMFYPYIYGKFMVFRGEYSIVLDEVNN